VHLHCTGGVAVETRFVCPHVLPLCKWCCYKKKETHASTCYVVTKVWQIGVLPHWSCIVLPEKRGGLECCCAALDLHCVATIAW
jgi:hypothetical protein